MRDMAAVVAAEIDRAVGATAPLKPVDDFFAEIERIMAEVREGPPPIWCYYVSSKVPTIKRQWRSDGRLIVWLPRSFYESLKRHNYAPGIDLYAVEGARFGTPVEEID